MSLREFVIDNVFEFVLVALCGACLSMVVGDGFNLAYETLFNVPVVLACVLPLLLVCYWGAYLVQAGRRKLLWAPIVACLLLMGVVVWTSTFTSQAGTSMVYSYTQGTVLDDEPGNNTSFGYVLAIVPVLCFLLSRTRVLCAVLFMLGVFCCGLDQWLFVEWLWVPFVGFLAGSIALFVLRTYKRLRTGAVGGAGAGAVWQVPLACAVVPLVLVAGAFGVWKLAIEPANPQAAELKLVQLHYKPDVEELTNYQKKTPTWINPNDFSNKVDKKYKIYTSNPGGEGSQEQNTDEETENKKETGGSGGISYALQGLVDNLNPVNYDPDDWTPLIVALVLVALVVGAILLRRYLRTRWYKGLDEHAQAWRVCALYDRLTRSLERMRFVKPAPATQVEHATSVAGAMAAFEQDAGGASWLSLSRIYERVYYGHADPSADDVNAFEAFWHAFHKNARRYSGPLRYIWRFWRI